MGDGKREIWEIWEIWVRWELWGRAAGTWRGKGCRRGRVRR